MWLFRFLTGRLQNIFLKIVHNKSSNLKVKKTFGKLSFLIHLNCKMHPKFQLLRTRKLLVFSDILFLNKTYLKWKFAKWKFLFDKQNVLDCNSPLAQVLVAYNFLNFLVVFFLCLWNAMFIYALEIGLWRHTIKSLIFTAISGLRKRSEQLFNANYRQGWRMRRRFSVVFVFANTELNILSCATWQDIQLRVRGSGSFLFVVLFSIWPKMRVSFQSVCSQ